MMTGLLLYVIFIHYQLFSLHLRQKRHEKLTMAMVNLLKIAMVPKVLSPLAAEEIPSDDSYN